MKNVGIHFWPPHVAALEDVDGIELLGLSGVGL